MLFQVSERALEDYVNAERNYLTNAGLREEIERLTGLVKAHERTLTEMGLYEAKLRAKLAEQGKDYASDMEAALNRAEAAEAGLAALRERERTTAEIVTDLARLPVRCEFTQNQADYCGRLIKAARKWRKALSATPEAKS